jgi:hypothetical protein
MTEYIGWKVISSTGIVFGCKEILKEAPVLLD